MNNLVKKSDNIYVDPKTFEYEDSMTKNYLLSHPSLIKDYIRLQQGDKKRFILLHMKHHKKVRSNIVEGIQKHKEFPHIEEGNKDILKIIHHFRKNYYNNDICERDWINKKINNLH